MSFGRRHDTANFRIPFQINWVVMLILIASILLSQFAESIAEQQASSSHGKKHRNGRCLNNLRRSMVRNKILQNVEKDPAIMPHDVLLRLETAAILRDHLIMALGKVLLLCLNDDARVPFERIHDVVRTRQVAVYELLHILPVLRNKIPRQQLYKLLQMLERVGSRFVSEYASLCINVFSDIDMKRASLLDMLSNIDDTVIESISRDKYRDGEVPLSLSEGMNFLLHAARKDNQILNMRTASAILLNYPKFDLTDPEVSGAIRFVAQRMRERSRPDDPLLQYMELNLDNANDFLRIVLKRLEVDELSSDVTKEAVSLLLQNLDMESYPRAPNWKDNPKKLLMIKNDYYPSNAIAVAKYLLNHLNDSHLRDLDIGFYETGDHALLQVLLRLRKKPQLQHLRKPLSLLIPFVSQKLMNDASYNYTAPINFYEVNDYLDSFDMPCLQDSLKKAMKMLRPHLTEDLPWTYAFGNRQVIDNPWELTMTALIRLRNVPMNEPQAIAIDNFVYKGRTNALAGKRELLYDSGTIFQRDDSVNVEIDFYSLLMRIPNAFKSEKFAPMLNFMSKPNILNIFGYEFNKFEYDTPRNLLLALLKRALILPLVKSDRTLSRVLRNAHNYLEEPLLVNQYTSGDLQLLLKNLPGIESDPRYIPLKMLFKKQKLLTYLSPTFSLSELHTPIEKLLLILRTVSLKVTQPKLSEALMLAFDSIDGPPLPARAFDREDFIYLTKQLLSHNKPLQNEILRSPVYSNISNWNISVSGTPENVLVRALNYPVDDITSNAHLAYVVKRAEDTTGEKGLINIELLKEQTLGSMIEYLPNSTYVKPVILLLRKANLMTLVPKLNLMILENATARDALIMLLKNLTESRLIRAEKLLLRRIRNALSSLDAVGENHSQTSIFAYLIQCLQDPSNVVYEPLLQEMNKLKNITISMKKQQTWLQNYLQQIVTESKTEDLKKAALMALREVAYDENDEESRASKARIRKAISFLPIDSLAEPLRKLLTPDWVYNILPEEFRNSNQSEKEELLLAILYYAKQRTDVASNPSLMRIISKVEMNLNGWRTNVEPLRTAVAAIKSAVYDPVKIILTPIRLNKIGITVFSERSAKVSLLELLHNLIQHPMIKDFDKVFRLLSIVRQDVFAFGRDVDLLTILDDVGIAYTSELAPIRLFLHRKDINKKLAHIVFAVAHPKERYRTLLELIQKSHQLNNDTRFFNALSKLKSVRLSNGELAGTQLSDLSDIVNAIPHRIKQQFASIEHLFNANILSRLTSDNDIVESKTPLITLLSRIMDLPEIRSNYSATNILNSMRSEIELDNRPIVTGFQLRPLLLELQHVQQINVDFLNYILDPEILSYLNSEEFADMSNDNIEILKTIIEYLLNKGPAYVDNNIRRHLQSFKRALMLVVGPDASTNNQLSKEDWKKMLTLIPRKKNFAPIRIFLQSKEIFKYIPEHIDWKIFSTPGKKLLHLLSLMENTDIENKNVEESASKLRENLEERFNFITEQEVKNIHRTLVSLKLKYDIVPLKIFLNHDNLIKYLPPDFKYSKYNASIDAFTAILDNLLHVPSLRRRVTLYNVMIFVKQSLLEQTSTRRSYRKFLVRKQLSSKDIEFVNLLNIPLPKLREFLNSRKLVRLLPQSFNFHNRPTFKRKALHLLRQLLKLNTDLQPELKSLLREVEFYPDVPEITKEDITQILKIIPLKGIPHIELVKKYLKQSMLVKLLPGNFDIKKLPNAKVALHDILLFLSVTVGSAKSDEMKMAIDALVNELTKTSSTLIPEEALVDNNEIRSIINEIPFKQYKQITQLATQMTTARVIKSLPLNFQLIKYKTKKLKLLAILDELSKSDAFRSSENSINFVRRVVSKMPDMPKVNDTEIEKLLLPLSLNTFYVKYLVTNCKLMVLAPYLPIHFDLSGIETRKKKIAKILHYCKQANPKDVSTRQALTNAEASLERLPDFDITREQVDALIRAIPCTHFTSIKPLLRFLSKVDVTPLLPWDLNLYKSHTFKLRIFDLLTSLRNVKELQNDKMFSALDTLETTAKSLPNKVIVGQELIINLRNVKGINTEPCRDYRELVLKPENLIKILPPNYSIKWIRYLHGIHYTEWWSIFYFSMLFLPDVRMEGPMKKSFNVCMDTLHNDGKNYLIDYMKWSLGIQRYKKLVSWRLYTLGHKNNFFQPIKDFYRNFFPDSLFKFLRIALKEFIRRPEIVRSKSLVSDMEVFLYDYMHYPRNNSSSFSNISHYEINEAIREIPNDDKYDDLRLLMQCQDIQKPILDKYITVAYTSKQVLLELLQLAEKKSDIDEEIRENIKSIKPNFQDIHKDEVEHVLKQMSDYRYHVSKIEPLRSYLIGEGLQKVLGDDYHMKYFTLKEQLVAISDILATSTNLTSEVRAASDYLKRVLNNEIKIEHIIPRTMDDINVQTLFFALPKTRDERIIRGIIKFFSIPNLLRKLRLPKNPFEYVTKGRLLQAIMDVGQELESVQKDPVQQEALEYFRDKIIITGLGAQPIELKKYAHNSNVNVDFYGVMKAIDYSKANETVAANVAMFFENKYNNLVHAVGFDHMAYATRGAYLKALLEHLVNVSQVPDDVRQQMKSLIPMIRLDGPGNETVDLNDDITPDIRMFEEIDTKYGPHDVKSRSFKPIARFGNTTELPNSFQEKKESLKRTVHDMLESISSSEEDDLDNINGNSKTVYTGQTRVVIGVPQHIHDTTRRRLTNAKSIKHYTQSRIRKTNSDSFKKMKKSDRASNDITKITAVGRTKIKEKEKKKKKKKKNQSTANLSTSSTKIQIKHKKTKKVKQSKPRTDLNLDTSSDSLDYFSNGGGNSATVSGKRIVIPLSALQELSFKEMPKKSHHSHRRHLKSVVRRLLIHPEASIDYDESYDENMPVARMFRDVLQNNEDSLSLTKELMQIEQARNIDRKAKTVKKDLSRHMRERK